MANQYDIEVGDVIKLKDGGMHEVSEVHPDVNIAYFYHNYIEVFVSFDVIDEVYKPKNNNLLPHREQSCLVFAARYAHSRNTGAANVVVNTILQHWDQLSPELQLQLIKEAEKEATSNKEDWNRLSAKRPKKKCQTKEW